MENHKLFEAAADHLEEVGWTRGTYHTTDGKTCLVGGLGVARRNLCATANYLSNSLTPELAQELHDILKKRSALYRINIRVIEEAHPVRKREAQIQEAVELWNDAHYRRKSTVIKVLRKAAENSKKKYMENRVKWLEAEVTRLEAEISHLQNLLDNSTKEVSRLRRLLGYKQPTQADHDELQALSDELDQRWAELNALAI